MVRPITSGLVVALAALGTAALSPTVANAGPGSRLSADVVAADHYDGGYCQHVDLLQFAQGTGVDVYSASVKDSLGATGTESFTLSPWNGYGQFDDYDSATLYRAPAGKHQILLSAGSYSGFCQPTADQNGAQARYSDPVVVGWPHPFLTVRPHRVRAGRKITLSGFLPPGCVATPEDGVVSGALPNHGSVGVSERRDGTYSRKVRIPPTAFGRYKLEGPACSAHESATAKIIVKKLPQHGPSPPCRRCGASIRARVRSGLPFPPW